MFNKFRNKRIKKRYFENDFFYINNEIFILFGDEIELYDKNKGKFYSGKYRLMNNKRKMIGYIYYTIKLYDNSAVLGDIKIEEKFRKQGLATKLLNIFENSCMNHNVKYITGELSSIDEYGDNKKARDNFYLHRGYTISNSEIFKLLIK